ncbi:hypothetical protein NONO_c19830 [Nocardia nova SH22a]|uniref:Deoxyxylulose-5-phosphate synthase n=1 Tax=Nocardia nova SH22a TaxID=1415166 RepID=W5TCT9_9NOCA|nr:hypothetical protein [Nocardia nova]AHH16783.1 hypothetical protein NONO_c19830 [Nocardia nova SH22a]
MCEYGYFYKVHYVCVECRVSLKRPPTTATPECPRCRAEMVCAGHDFAAPPRRDTKAWSVVAAVLAAGLRYEGFQSCGCGREPKYRPSTRAELRARHRFATAQEIPLAEALLRRNL